MSRSTKTVLGRGNTIVVGQVMSLYRYLELAMPKMGGDVYDPSCKKGCQYPGTYNSVLVPPHRPRPLPGGIVNSDCWAAYNNLDQYGIQHYIVNHTQNLINPLTDEHTQHIESLWCCAKKFFSNHHYNSHENLEKYIAEWCFRYNN